MKYKVNYYRHGGETAFSVFFPEIKICTSGANLQNAREMAKELLVDFLANKFDAFEDSTESDFEDGVEEFHTEEIEVE